MCEHRIVNDLSLWTSGRNKFLCTLLILSINMCQVVFCCLHLFFSTTIMKTCSHIYYVQKYIQWTISISTLQGSKKKTMSTCRESLRQRRQRKENSLDCQRDRDQFSRDQFEVERCSIESSRDRDRARCSSLFLKMSLLAIK